MYQNYKPANLSSFPTYQSSFQPNNPIFLFIGTITDFVTDEAMEGIFKICGELNSWLRPKDISGNPKNFGFCEFSDLESIFKVLKYLNQLELPSPKIGTQTKRLTIKIDNQHKKTIDEYSKTRLPAQNELEIENQIKSEIQKVIQSTILDPRAEQEKDLAELVGKEVSALRMMADSNARLSGENGQDNDGDEEDEINQKQEKEMKQLYDTYYERVKLWELREQDKLRTYDKDAANDVTDVQKRQERRQMNEELMNSWDDDVEMEKGSHEYYKDRSDWWQRRQPILKRELDQDERDRLQEKMEIEARLKRIDLNRNDETGSLSDSITHEEISQPDTKTNNELNAPAPQPSTKLTMNLSTNRKRVAGPVIPAITDQHESDDESSTRAQRKLVPLEYSDSEEESDARRKKKIKKLVDSIPTDKDPLFKWAIRWDQVDANIRSKLKSFTDKKIQEYLGLSEPELVKFIMDQISAKKSPGDLVKSLDGALDQDSELFVMRLWRMLIYESEAKYLHIS